jgi:hypothetical protein
MMGVPVIRLGGKAEYTPPLARSNCILIEDWGDRAAIEEGMERSEPIVAEADRCYRTGWSLRGQLCQIFARLGLVEARIHSPQVTASRDKNPVLMAQSGTAPSQPMGEPIP